MIGNIVHSTSPPSWEIAGCFAFWVWLRRGHSAAFALPGIISLRGLPSR